MMGNDRAAVYPAALARESVPLAKPRVALPQHVPLAPQPRELGRVLGLGGLRLEQVVEGPRLRHVQLLGAGRAEARLPVQRRDHAAAFGALLPPRHRDVQPARVHCRRLGRAPHAAALEDRPGEPRERLRRREHLHHPRPALDLGVQALLQVVRPDPPRVLAGEVEVGERVRPRLLQQGPRVGVLGREQLRGLREARPHELRVGLAEGDLELDPGEPAASEREQERASPPGSSPCPCPQARRRASSRRGRRRRPRRAPACGRVLHLLLKLGDSLVVGQFFSEFSAFGRNSFARTFLTKPSSSPGPASLREAPRALLSGVWCKGAVPSCVPLHTWSP